MLDAMPGKRMAIDAELRAGTIDGIEARRRRRQLSRESQLYGSMDGAMKFVERDFRLRALEPPLACGRRPRDRGSMYRAGRATLAYHLEERLGRVRFRRIDTDLRATALGVERVFHQRFGRLNRGVLLASPQQVGLGEYVGMLRSAALAVMGGSWWRSPLSLQLVFEVDGPPPERAVLGSLVPWINFGSAFIHSIYAIDRVGLARTFACKALRLPDDPIASALEDFSRGTSGPALGNARG